VLDRFKRLFRSAVYGPEPITSGSVVGLFSSGVESQAGIAVDRETALGNAAVIAAVRCVAETVAMIPLNVYRRSYSNNKRFIEKAVEHPLYQLLHDAPNPEQTSFEWREAFVAQILVYGNGFAEIVRDRYGRVVELWPILAHRTRLERRNGSAVYFVTVNGVEHALAPSQVFHVRGFNLYGLVGDSLLEMARDCVGTALAGERWAAKFFANGARPGGIISYPRRISEESARRLRESFESMHRGLGNAQRVAILEEGAEYKEVGIDPEASQLLESRQYSVTEIARIFRLPPHKIGDLSRATFSNIEHQAIEFMEVMQPWFKRIEQRINMQLLTPAERREHYAEFLAKGLLRTDTKTQGEFYNLMRNVGAFSANDIRELENLNPLPGGDGDIYLVPANYLPASSVAAPAARRESRAARPGIRDQHRPRLAVAADRWIRGEVRELKKTISRALAAGDSRTLREKIAAFFAPDAESLNFAFKTLAPSVLAFARDVAVAAAEEASGARAASPGDEQVDAVARQHLGRSLRQSRSVAQRELESAIRESETPEEIAEEIGRRTEEWIDGGASRRSRGEQFTELAIVRIEGAISRDVWARDGGAKKIVWRVSQGGKCPLCDRLDGTVVGIDGVFVRAGEQIEHPGKEEPFKASVDIFHPPLHRGCDCRLELTEG